MLFNRFIYSAFFVSMTGLSFTANAGDYYVDLSYVKSTTDQTRGSMERALNNDGINATVIQFDNTHESVRPTLGYAFTRNHAIEVSYLDLGESSAQTRVLTFDPNSVTSAELQKYAPQAAEGATLSYRGSVCLDNNWTGSLELGAYRWEAENQLGAHTQKLSGTDFLWGARLDYKINANWQLGVQHTQIHLPKDTAKLLSIGVRYSL